MKRWICVLSLLLTSCGTTPKTEVTPPAPAKDPIVSACENRVVKSCLIAAESFEARGDMAEAARLYGIACDANDTWGCVMAGAALLEDESTLPKAAARFRRGCELGEWASCHGLGLLQEGLYGGVADMDAAVLTYQEACSAQFQDSCRRLGVIGVRSSEVDKQAAGEKLLQLNCDLEDGDSCFELARHRLDQKKVEGTLNLLIVGCESGSSDACAELGFSYSAGRDTPKNAELSRGAFMKACAANPPSQRACGTLGWFEFQGKGGAKDAVLGKTRMGDACAQYSSLGCFYRGAAALIEKEDSTPWIEKACEADETMCSWFKDNIKIQN